MAEGSFSLSLSLRGTSGERAGGEGLVPSNCRALLNPLSLTLSPLLRRGERESAAGMVVVSRCARRAVVLAYLLDINAPSDRECSIPFEEGWQGERFKVICVESSFSWAQRYARCQRLSSSLPTSFPCEIPVYLRRKVRRSNRLHLLGQGGQLHRVPQRRLCLCRLVRCHAARPLPARASRRHKPTQPTIGLRGG